MSSKNFKSSVVTGIVWSAVQLAINRGLSFIIKMVLAKLLFPEQFGLVGMAAVFASFVQVFNDIGIGAALVQRKDKDLREEHFQTAFWTGVIWSTSIYLLIVIVVSPLAAIFYKEPMLRQIIPALSLGVLASPVNLVHQAQLTRAMSFKKLAFISNVSTAFSGVLSLTLAYLGAGVWSLVFNSVATIVIAMPLFFRATGWTPKLMWDKKAFKDVFGFGVYTTGTNLFNNLISNIDYLLIGKLLSAAALGTYTLAFVLTDTFRNQLMAMMGKVMYPVYGKKQDDPKALKRYYLKVVKYNSIFVYPAMIFFITLGTPFVQNYFGQKWIGAIEPLKILAVSVMIHMLTNSHASLIRGLGKPKLEMKIQFFKAVFLYVPLISLGIHFYGIVGAAYAYVLNKIFEVFIAQYFLKKLVNVTFGELLFHMRTPLIASVVAFIVSTSLYSLHLHYILCGVALFISYCAVVWLFMKDELKTQLSDLKFLKKKNLAVQ
ncbi:lipopolysaccharide biosynthesis protein [Pontibacter liquoris]|uniref:lipopolysaccharide biosynthesis protein n=1 Tax=Pontibacter liquoris TaxID=2905677 RepID=UPI001FA750C4|nr:lipopolysaccharide biosynthesis protein [Pontibacter liquoris]